MLIDESDLSAARGAPVQRHITQPKHAGNSLCDGEFFNLTLGCECGLQDARFFNSTSRQALPVHLQNFTKFKTGFSGMQSGITERLSSFTYEFVNVFCLVVFWTFQHMKTHICRSTAYTHTHTHVCKVVKAYIQRDLCTHDRHKFTNIQVKWHVHTAHMYTQGALCLHKGLTNINRAQTDTYRRPCIKTIPCKDKTNKCIQTF